MNYVYLSDLVNYNHQMKLKNRDKMLHMLPLPTTKSLFCCFCVAWDIIWNYIELEDGGLHGYVLGSDQFDREAEFYCLSEFQDLPYDFRH